MDASFCELIPPDVQRSFSWDRCNRRVYETRAVECLCEEFRVRFNQTALRAFLARRVVSAVLLAWPQDDDISVSGMRSLILAHLLHGLPRARELANVVVVTFQKIGAPVCRISDSNSCRSFWVDSSV